MNRQFICANEVSSYRLALIPPRISNTDSAPQNPKKLNERAMLVMTAWHLGYLYLNGKGVPRNLQQGRELLDRSCEHI